MAKKTEEAVGKSHRIDMSDWRPSGVYHRSIHWWDSNEPLGVVSLIGFLLIALVFVLAMAISTSDMDTNNKRLQEQYESAVQEYDHALLRHERELEDLANAWNAIRVDGFEDRYTAQYVLWSKARELALSGVTDESNLTLLADLQKHLGYPYDRVDAPVFVRIVNGSDDWPVPVFSVQKPEEPTLRVIDWQQTIMLFLVAWAVVIAIILFFSLSEDQTRALNAGNIRLSTAWMCVLIHPWIVIPWGITVITNALEYGHERARRVSARDDAVRQEREQVEARQREERERLDRLDPDLRALYQQSQTVREEMQRELAGLRKLKHVDHAQVDELEARLREVDAELARVFERQTSREQAADQQRVLAVAQRLENSFAVLRGMAQQVEELTRERHEEVAMDGASLRKHPAS